MPLMEHPVDAGRWDIKGELVCMLASSTREMFLSQMAFVSVATTGMNVETESEEKGNKLCQ